MQKSKIDSLLGFAVKAGKVVYGNDSIEKSRARLYAILIDSDLSPNTRKKIVATAKEKSIPIIVSRDGLENAVSRKNCKVIAVTDRQMAEAMLKYLDDGHCLYTSEVN